MSEAKTYPLIIGGEMVDKKETLPVYCKYDGGRSRGRRCETGGGRR